MDFARAIYVSTSSWALSAVDRLSFETADGPGPTEGGGVDKLDDLLRRLLDPDLPGRAWLRDDGAGVGGDEPRWVPSEPERSWDAELRVFQLAAGISERVQHEWVRARLRALPRRREELAATLERIRHRVFLDVDRARSLFWTGDVPLTPDVPFFAMLDFRFVPLFRQLRCHVSTSIWSHPPRNPIHRPTEIRDVHDTVLAASVAVTMANFERAATAAEGMIGELGFPATDFRVRGRRYVLPRFLVAVPRTYQSDPAAYLDQPLAELTWLSVGAHHPRDSSVSCGVINGRMLALRRVRRTAHGDAPTYLMLPGGSDLAQGTGRPEAELEVAQAIVALTDLEAEAAGRLFEAQADMEISRNHLQVYNAVAERAGFLLDALTTHLPIRRPIKLDRAHRYVELLHQTLLQAVADLGHVAAIIRSRASGIRETADELRDSFDARLTERSPWVEQGCTNGLRVALTETGLFEAAQRHGQDNLTEAERVKTSYDDLMQAIGSAFDERRVREFDQIQKASALLAAGLATTAVASAVDALNLVDAEHGRAAVGWLIGLLDGSVGSVLRWFSPGGIRWSTASIWAARISALSAVVVLGAAVYVGYRLLAGRRLGSRTFQKRYDGRGVRRRLALIGARPTDPVRWPRLDGLVSVWQLLLETSTHNLDRLAKLDHQARPWARLERSWPNLDIHFARAFAACWDGAGAGRATDRHYRAGADISQIGQQIETWMLQSLLLTERPRRMYRYQLPNLACLYRCCAQIADSFLHESYVSDASMIAEIDFQRSMERLGFSREEALRIDDWLRYHDHGPLRYNSAAEALERIDRLGLDSGMDKAARMHTTEHVLTARSEPGCHRCLALRGRLTRPVPRPRRRGEAANARMPLDNRGHYPALPDEMVPVTRADRAP